MDDKESEPPKKCFCARCFFPIDPADKVDIDGQNFHRFCSMCCVCRKIPTSLKMFYGHVFCNDCFKTHVQSRFKGDSQPHAHCHHWCGQWSPFAKPQTATEETKEPAPDSTSKESKPEVAEQLEKPCMCGRCFRPIDAKDIVNIGGRTFHSQCAKCHYCHCIPTTNPKIYYGHLFCEDCFNKHVLSPNKNSPSEFFKNCYEQWQSNKDFAEAMRQFMTGNKDNKPFIFMMNGQPPPFCSFGSPPEQT